MARKAPAFAALAAEYARLFDSARIAPAHAAGVDATARKIAANRQRYEDVVRGMSVPWWIVALLHAMESNCDFRTHLHNGDPLTARTRQVPAGRPKIGNPPFTFGDSARDALEYDGLTNVPAGEWTVERACYELEKFNGWGTRWRGVFTPYLWSYTQHYRAGKYVRDGVWSATAVSEQSGAMAILIRLAEITDLELPRHAFSVPAVPVGGGKLQPAKSRTVLGALYVVLGAIVTFLQWAGAFAKDVVAAAKAFKDPAEQALSEVGANIPALSFIAIAIGVLLVLYARSDDAANNPK